MRNSQERRSIAPWVVPALAIMVATGCSSSTPSGEGGPSRRVLADAPNVTQGRLGLAETLAAQGNFQAALDVLRSALAAAGSPDLRREIQELRLALKRRALAQSLGARLVAPEHPIVAGEMLPLEIELTNRGQVRIAIPAADYRRRALVFSEVVGKTVLDLVVEVTEFDPRGTRVSERSNRLWEPDEDIDLGPGESWRRPIPLDSATLRPGTMLLKAVSVRAQLHPVRIRVDGRDFFSAVNVEPAVAFLLPRGAEAMREDPLRHLELALRRAPAEPRFLPHVMIAASLLKDDARDRGKALLVAAREQGAGMLRPSATQALELFWPEAVEAADEPAVIFRSDVRE